MATMSTVPAIIPGLSDRDACVDALYRYASGLDHGDRAMLASAWTADAELDLSDLTKMGMGGRGGEGGITRGRDAIVDYIITAVGFIGTTHMITNPRVWLEEGADGAAPSSARLTALTLAMHAHPEEARDFDKRGALAGSEYVCNLRKDDDGVWKLSKLVLLNTWWEGDKTVLAS